MSKLITVTEAPLPEIGPYDPVRDREAVRRNLAYGMLAFLVLLMAALAVASLFYGVTEEQAGIVITTILPATLGITGVITGFYFASKER